MAAFLFLWPSRASSQVLPQREELRALPGATAQRQHDLRMPQALSGQSRRPFLCYLHRCHPVVSSRPELLQPRSEAKH